MNNDDLWVDFETGIVLSTNRNQGIFLCLFWLSHRLIHKQNLLFSVALAKNEKAERTYFKKIKPNKREPKDQFSAVTGGSNWSFLYKNPEKHTKLTREETKMKRRNTIRMEEYQQKRERSVYRLREGWMNKSRHQLLTQEG